MDRDKITKLLRDADWDKKKLWSLKEHIDEERRSLKRLLKLVTQERHNALLKCPISKDEKVNKINRDLTFLKDHRSIVRSRIHALQTRWKRAKVLLREDPFVGSAFTSIAEKLLTKRQYDKIMSKAIKLKQYDSNEHS